MFPDPGYEVAFEGGTPQRMTFVLSRGLDRWMRLPLEYSVAPKVTKYGCDLGALYLLVRGRIETHPAGVLLAQNREPFPLVCLRPMIAKIISASQGFSETPAQQTFQDMPEGSPFYAESYRLAMRNVISGYACGGPGEPCTGGNRPYFRPNRDVTRGQISKMLSQAIGPFTGASAAQDK